MGSSLFGIVVVLRRSIARVLTDAAKGGKGLGAALSVATPGF
jgi:hypothetical protein